MPSSRVLSFTDPFAYQSAFRSVDVELFPTVKGGIPRRVDSSQPEQTMGTRRP